MFVKVDTALVAQKVGLALNLAEWSGPLPLTRPLATLFPTGGERQGVRGCCHSITQFYIRGLLLALVILSCACVKNVRTVRNENFYILKPETNRPTKVISHRDQNSLAMTDLSDSIRRSGQVQGSNAARSRTTLTNVNVLEEENSEVVSVLEKIKERPDKAENHFQLASIYHRFRVYDKACAEYEKAIQIDPGVASYYEALGRLWRDWGDPQSGITFLQKALQVKTDLVEAWVSLGSIHDELGEFSHAQQCYLRALEFNPRLEFVHNNLCFSYLQTGELEKAIYHGEQAVLLSPDLAVAHNNLALAYGMANDFSRAFSHFKLASDEARAHNNLGVVLLKKQRVAEAMEHFKLAAKLRPFYKVAARNYYYAKSLRFEVHRNPRKEELLEKQESGLIEVGDLASTLPDPSYVSLRALSSRLIGPNSEYLWARGTVPVKKAQLGDPPQNAEIEVNPSADLGIFMRKELSFFIRKIRTVFG